MTKDEKLLMCVTADDGDYWIEGHDYSDAVAAFGEDITVVYYIATRSDPYCVDEGCEHYGTPHICIAK